MTLSPSPLTLFNSSPSWRTVTRTTSRSRPNNNNNKSTEASSSLLSALCTSSSSFFALTLPSGLLALSLSFQNRISSKAGIVTSDTFLCNLDEQETSRGVIILFQTPTEIMEVFKRRKNVLLFSPSLDISDDNIEILKPIHEIIEKDNQYVIVWIPIVGQWTDGLKKKFDIVKNKMPWFTVQYSGSIAGIKFIKEEWKGRPMMVVLNPQGRVTHPNAIHMIRIWGDKAFPFTTTKEQDCHVLMKINGLAPLLQEFAHLFPLGWGMLSKGSIMLLTCHGDSVLNVLDCEKWKEDVKETEFGLCFKCIGLDITQTYV